MGLVPNTVLPTPADFLAATPETQRKLWSDTILDAARMADDAYENQMGTSVAGKPAAGGRIVEVARDTAVGRGQEVTFTIRREVYRQGVRAGANFSDPTQYNARSVGFDKCKVELKSDAIMTDLYTDQVMGFLQDLLGGDAELLGRLHGRQRQRDLMMTTMWMSSSENRLYAGGKTKLADLTSGDALRGNDLMVAKSILVGTFGATPAYVRTDDNGNSVPGFHQITTAEGYEGLEGDPEIQRALELAAQRGPENELFSGGLKHWRGHTVQWLSGVLHADAGEVGSPFAPTAILGKPIGLDDQTNGLDSTEAVTGGRKAAFADACIDDRR